MLEAIESARLSVTMEQYIFWDGEVARRFAEVFSSMQSAQPRSAGRFSGSWRPAVAWFRPVHWYTLHRANRRNHRKSLIVGGRIAFTGAAGIVDHWLGNAAGPREWRDIQIGVEGHAVLAQQTGFAQNWLAATGQILVGHQFFPEPDLAGDVPVQTILSSPSSGAGAAGTMYLIALQCARRFVYVANPYFIPDSRAIALLLGACRRGVKVKLMLAGQHNDTWWARQNSLRLYGRLLDAGVEIYEYQPTMLHQKTMVVDGAWATVGTGQLRQPFLRA